jgi:hypothetical protein
MESFKPIYMEWWENNRENNRVSKNIKVNYLHHYGRQRKKTRETMPFKCTQNHT